MKKKLFLLTLLLFSGCEQRTEGSTQINEEKELTKKEVSEVKEENLLKELGFEINGQKVTIDMNKTTEFMKKIENQMQSRANKIEHKIKDINFTKGLGVEVNGDSVLIDLNKTKDMLQQINTLMKDILLDKNSTLH